MTTTANILALAHVRGIVASYANGGECDQCRRLIFADYLDEIGEEEAAKTSRWLADNNKWPMLSAGWRSGGWYSVTKGSSPPGVPKHSVISPPLAEIWHAGKLYLSHGRTSDALLESELLIIGLGHLCLTPAKSAV